MDNKIRQFVIAILVFGITAALFSGSYLCGILYLLVFMLGTIWANTENLSLIRETIGQVFSNTMTFFVGMFKKVFSKFSRSQSSNTTE